MKRVLALVFVLMLAAGVLAAEKNYQTGKLVDADLQLYTHKAAKPRHENTLAVQVGDMVYFGQCEQKKNSDRCRPADWIVGDPIDVRFEKSFMYVKKARGGEIKTQVVKRERAH